MYTQILEDNDMYEKDIISCYHVAVEQAEAIPLANAPPRPHTASPTQMQQLQQHADVDSSSPPSASTAPRVSASFTPPKHAQSAPIAQQQQQQTVAQPLSKNAVLGPYTIIPKLNAFDPPTKPP